jgi:hypothetical protein
LDHAQRRSREISDNFLKSSDATQRFVSWFNKYIPIWSYTVVINIACDMNVGRGEMARKKLGSLFILDNIYET